MAAYNDNTVYLSIDGTQVDSWFKSVTLSPTIETVDTTRGSGTDHRSRSEGLKDTSGTITIGYDAASEATILGLVEPGTHALVYGPRGNTAGMPKHAQSIIITQAPHSVEVSKGEVVFEVQWEAAAAPSSDMYAGDTW